MRGSDRCDEIIRLIDESLDGTAPRPVATLPAEAAAMPADPQAGDDRRRRQLLDVVGEFLASITAEGVPRIA